MYVPPSDLDSSTNTNIMCYLKSCTVHIPKFVLNVFYSWDLRIPLQVSHFCKIQPDVSIKALSSLKFPQYSQRWRVNWVSGESPTLPPVSVLVGSTPDADKVSANQWRGRCRQRRLLSRPVNRRRTNREARPAYHS